jgi:uncharacterized membrane protein
MDARHRVGSSSRRRGYNSFMENRDEIAVSVADRSIARRWTVIASGLLLLALALVVIYTRPVAFLSPVALVVVSAIGLAALLLQVRFRGDLPLVESPFWLNVLGLVCAAASLGADYLHIERLMLDALAFGAVVCFGISAAVIFQALRKHARAAAELPKAD